MGCVKIFPARKGFVAKLDLGILIYGMVGQLIDDVLKRAWKEVVVA
jgi:hypothetical protein